jgi:hypothetical protein
MIPKMKMDKIVQDVISDIVTMTDSDEIDQHIQQAINTLDEVDYQSSAEQDYLTQSKQSIANAQMKLGLNEREAVLTEIATRVQSLSNASRQLDASAAQNIMVKLSGSANKVLEVVSEVKQLATVLKEAVDDPTNANADSLSEKVNTALNSLQSLKAP